MSPSSVVLSADPGLISPDFRASERTGADPRAGRRSRGTWRAARRSADPDRISGASASRAAGDRWIRRLRVGCAGGTAAGALAAVRSSCRAQGRGSPTRGADRIPRSCTRTRGVDVDGRRRGPGTGGGADGTACRPLSRAAAAARTDAFTTAELFGRWLPSVEELPEARKVRWSLDVDPLELF